MIWRWWWCIWLAFWPLSTAAQSLEPDALENNWSIETAVPIAVGVIYELNFVCPVPNGCEGGDHDYLRVGLKSGVTYQIATFDLAPGVDTVIELFWWSPTLGWQVVAANDDAFVPHSLLSSLAWQAPIDGAAIVRIAPRLGGQPTIGPPPTYRFMVAIEGSPAGIELQRLVAEQAGLATAAPLDTPAPPVSSEPSAPIEPFPAAPSVSLPDTAPAIEDAAPPLSFGPGGPAVLLSEQAFYAVPEQNGPPIASLPAGAALETTGRVQGIWAEVLSPEIVGLVWVDRRSLRPLEAPLPAVEIPAPLDASPPVTLVAPPASAAAPVVRLLPSAPAANLPRPEQRQIEVQLFQAELAIGGMQVQILDPFGEVLAEGLTRSEGIARFTLIAPPRDQLWVQIPAFGVRVPLNASNASIVVRLFPAEEVSDAPN